MTIRSPEQHVILIVDDVPENLAVLSDALDDAGYMVLVATDGRSALERLGYVTPHLILLDAVMPGMDGFETCRRIRAQPGASHIPVIFMTGLTETEHVVRGFEVGGNDYVIKPLQPREVIARIAAQLRSASQISMANTASDASAHAVIVLDRQGRPIWQTSKALAWLDSYFPQRDALPALPLPVLTWIAGHLDQAALDPLAVPALVVRQAQADPCALHATHELRIRFSRGERSGDLLLILDEIVHAVPSAPPMASFQLTPRENDVLTWLAKGKTNRDIADILGMSPRTVNKHLEHIFVKLGVETRSAAAALAVGRQHAASESVQ
ncbi:response regulator transcription factor [Actimicrobium antarcticum]|uniref:Response regulator transcription factor n=1 Tax=Actimicrobium antarcticum TaxID=1051899 RepID=A0ABP7TG42_9BURK